MTSNNLLHSVESYESAIKKLFPLGEYWDAQFENPESDISKWVRLKAEEIHRFRNRFRDLITESSPKTAERTLDDWERILLGAVNPSLPQELRRSLLLAQRRGHIDRTVLQEIAALYGAKIRRTSLISRRFSVIPGQASTACVLRQVFRSFLSKQKFKIRQTKPTSKVLLKLRSWRT